MGILFVLIFWVVVGTAIVLPCALLGAAVGRRLGRSGGRLRQKRWGTAGGLLPIAAGLYLVLCMFLMAIFSLMTGRDIGIGDGFELPLPNGYRWVAVDVTDTAAIMGTGEQPVFDNVMQLQQNGDWLAGAYDSHYDRSGRLTKNKPDHWFLFNTRDQRPMDVSSEQQLAQSTGQQGFTLHLASSERFYAKRRFRWYDGVAGVVLLAPGFGALLWTYTKIRHSLRSMAIETTASRTADPLRG